MKKSDKKIIEKATAILEKEEKKGSGLTGVLAVCTMIALLGLTIYALVATTDGDEEFEDFAG